MESEHDPVRPRFLDLGVLAIEVNGSEQPIGGRQLATILTCCWWMRIGT